MGVEGERRCMWRRRRDSCVVISGCRGADQVSGRPVSAEQGRSG